MQTIFRDEKIESGRHGPPLAVALVSGTLLLMIAAWAWFSYMVAAIAYGDIAGLAGRAHDLAELSFRARVALPCALIFEGSGLSILAWLVWARFRREAPSLAVCISCAWFLDLMTYLLLIR